MGKLAGAHEGGNTGFAFDITDLLTNETELLEVCVTDPCDDETILRGKQFWQKKPVVYGIPDHQNLADSMAGTG